MAQPDRRIELPPNNKSQMSGQEIKIFHWKSGNAATGTGGRWENCCKTATRGGKVWAFCLSGEKAWLWPEKWHPIPLDISIQLTKFGPFFFVIDFSFILLRFYDSQPPDLFSSFPPNRFLWFDGITFDFSQILRSAIRVQRNLFKKSSKIVKLIPRNLNNSCLIFLIFKKISIVARSAELN